MKRVLFILTLLSSVFALYAQTEKDIIDRFVQQLKLNAQEKTYTHTDAADYAPGDRIWLKVYVVNALSHVPSSESLYAYVELIAPDETMVCKAKILCRDGVYAGYLDIPQSAKSGRYMVRSYTDVSKNAPNYESFHPIYVGGTGKRKSKKEKNARRETIIKDNLLDYTRHEDKITIKTQLKEDSLILLAHCRAYPFSITPIGKNQVVEFHTDSIPQGVISLLLINKNKEIIAERLLLSDNNQEQCNLDIKFDKGEYAANEMAHLSLDASDLHEGELADISISITGTSISQRHRPSSIIAHLMLATDVQGGLDNPESFFTNTQYADSMLSGCQWKRYDIGKMLKGDYSLPLNACETTQVISGRVQTLLRRKPVPNANVSLISPQTGNYAIATTNEKGLFTFTGFDYPDGTQYVIRANRDNGKENVELIIDEKDRPEFSHQAFSEESFDEIKIEADSLLDTDLGTIMLDDVEVMEKRRNSASEGNVFAQLADKSFSLHQIEESGATSLNELIRLVPGTIEKGNKFYIRGATSIYKKTPAAIAIDGIIVDSEYDINNIPMQDVARVDIFKTGSSVIWGTVGANGVISITTKVGTYHVSISEPLNQKKYTPQGYQKADSFFNQKGRRKTIYWNPHVTSNQIEVNLPHNPGTCHVVVEGVTTEGRLIHEERNMVIKP